MQIEPETFSRDPVAFITQFILKNELGRPLSLLPYQQEILRLAFSFDEEGRLPWETIIYSCPKKSGKTAMNALITCWWLFTQEAPNELLIVANDLDQSVGRTFKALVGIIRHNPLLAKSAEVQAQKITLSNGSTVMPLANEYASAAGSNHGLTSWDELWAYGSERSRRMWEELCPVPTRQNSIRFVSTYAGFEGESELLYDLYKSVVGTDEYPEGQGERLHATLPVYGNREARTFAYWDHEHRLPWQTTTYLDTQRKTLRPNTFLRIHENRWTNNASTFLTSELWDACVSAERTPLLPNRKHELFVGVDAGIKHDSSAVAAVYREEDRLILACHRIWTPSTSEPLDLEATIEGYLRELEEQFVLRRIYVDPFQMHRSITTLKADGLAIHEFPQTVNNTVRMGQALFDVLNGKNLCLYPSDELRQQAMHTVAIENPRGFRIAKEKASQKIDAVVALAMACVAAMDLAPSGIPELSIFDENTSGQSSEELQRQVQEEYEKAGQRSKEMIEEAVHAQGVYWPGESGSETGLSRFRNPPRIPR